MLTALFQLLVIAWLPGAAIFRLPLAARSARAALDPEERLFWAVVLSLCVTLAVVLALAAAGVYSLPRLLIANAVIAASASASFRFDLRLRAPAVLPRITSLLPLALVLIGAWRFFPPAEYVIGGKDPGVYFNEGIQLATRGTLFYEDPVVASVPATARDLFFPSHNRREYYGQRFSMGFFIMNPESGRIAGQFPHLFPASIAVGYGVGGLTAARSVSGVWAILGLLALYFMGARITGRIGAFAAAALLALTVVQVWFGRYPNSEMVMQALLFAALLATCRTLVDGDPFFAPVAGSLLGLLLFLRIDAALAIVGVLCGLLLFVAQGGRVPASFVLTLGVVSTIAAFYLLVPMRAYSYRASDFLLNLAWWHWALVAVGGACVAGLAAAGARRPALGERIRVLTPMAIAVALAVGAIYALWFRHPSGRLAERDAYALRTFTAYYFTLPALLAALAGYFVLARRAFWRAPAFFVTAAVFSFFFFYKTYIVPDHFWMARRFLPVILPAGLLFVAGVALGARTGRLPLRSVGQVVGMVFVVLLGMQYARASRPILEHVEYAGITARLQQLAARIHDRDLLIVESRDAATDLHTLSVPLAVVYSRNVLVFSSAVPDKRTLASFLDWARGTYARVLFLGAGGTDLLAPEWTVRVLFSDRYRVPEYDAPGLAYPRHAESKQFDYTLYELVADTPESTPDEFVLDVGTRDDLNVLRFHAKEDTEGRTIRWSQDVSYVILPRVKPGYREITLWMSSGGRPPAAPPARVTISLGETRLGTVEVADGFHPYALAILATVAERAAVGGQPVRLKLETVVWRPQDVLGVPDSRELGVMVDRLEVR